MLLMVSALDITPVDRRNPPSGMHIYVMLSCAFLATFLFLFGFMGFRLQSSIEIGLLGGPLVFGRPSLQLADFTL